MIPGTVIKIKEIKVISSWMLNEKNMHLIIISKDLNKLEIYTTGGKINFNCAIVIKYFRILF